MRASVFKRVFLPLLCLTSCAASAQNAFLGAWKLDPLTSRMPDEMNVRSKGGDTYIFDFGGGPETVVLGGGDQSGLDDTLLSVTAAGPDTWIVRRKKGGRLWIDATWKLSGDSRTLTDAYRQFGADGAMTMSMDYVYRRADDGKGFAADWQSIKETMNSPFVLEVKAFQEDGLSFVSPLGTTNATFDDEGHPNANPKSIRRVDDHTLIVTIRQGGKVAATEDVVLSPDEKTLAMTVHVVGRDRPNVLAFERK